MIINCNKHRIFSISQELQPLIIYHELNLDSSGKRKIIIESEAKQNQDIPCVTIIHPDIVMTILSYLNFGDIAKSNSQARN